MMDETTSPQTKLRTIFVFSVLLAILLAIVTFGYFATFNRPITTVILVRHAEKKIEPNNPDPDLTPDGEARARELARMLRPSGINAIYATQFKRTQETVKPLADATGITVTITDAKQPELIVEQILTGHRGQTVVVAGHNNTVPEIVSKLSGQNYPQIPESDYDNMYVVTVYRYGKAKVVLLKYGKENSQGIGSGTIVPINK